MSSRITKIIVGKTISAYFADGEKVATMKAHRLAERLADANQWTLNIERTKDAEAMANIEALAAELKGELTVTGDTSFKLKVEKKFIIDTTAPVEPKVYIRLGRDAIFDNTQAALEHVRNVRKEVAPANMVVGLTKTFSRGTVEGQIKSVFSDLITYGLTPAVAKKVSDFAEITGKDERYDSLRQSVETGSLTAEGFSVNETFKYFALIVTAKELASAAEQSATETEGDKDEKEVKAA